MNKHTSYSESDIEYIRQHYGIDMKVKEIAKHLGKEEHALRRWICYNREKHGFKKSRLRAVGTAYTYYCNTAKCYKTRIKNADGSYTVVSDKKGRATPLWPAERVEFVKSHYRVDMTAKQLAEHYGVTVTQMCSLIGHIRHKDPTYLIKKRAQIGDVKESVTTFGVVRKKVFTEQGWKHVKTGYHTKPKPEPVVYTPGQIVQKNTRHGIREYIADEAGKLHLKDPKKKKRSKPANRQPKPKSVVSIRRIEKKIPAIPKKSLDASRNPDKVKIMSDADKIAAGYRYVQINAKTRVLRHPSKLPV